MDGCTGRECGLWRVACAGHGAADEVERLSSFVDDCQAEPAPGAAGTSGCREASSSCQREQQQLEMTISLPPEAAQDFLGRWRPQLGAAMRDTGVIITLQHASEANASRTALCLQGRLCDLLMLSRSLTARGYFGKWTASCKAQLEVELYKRGMGQQPDTEEGLSLSSSGGCRPLSDPTLLFPSAADVIGGQVRRESDPGERCQPTPQQPGGKSWSGMPDMDGRASNRQQQRCHRAILCTRTDLAGSAVGAVVNAAACNKAPIL